MGHLRDKCDKDPNIRTTENIPTELERIDNYFTLKKKQKIKSESKVNSRNVMIDIM